MRTYTPCKSCRQLRKKLDRKIERDFRWKFRLKICTLVVIARLLSFLILLLTCYS